MSFFNKKKWKSIHQFKDQNNLFLKLLCAPKKINIIINGTSYLIYLLDIKENNLIFAFLDPLYLNQELKPNFQYKFSIESLIHFDTYEIEFSSIFCVLDKNQSQLLFSYPIQLKLYSEDYILYPSESDNVKISFALKKLPYFKKIKQINRNEMQFEAELQHFIAEYNHKVLFDIDLYFPFDKVKIAATFGHINKNIFTFKDYMQSSLTQDAYLKYAVDYYKRAKNIVDYEETFNSEDDEMNENTLNNNNKIFICDLKQSVTDYLYQFLKNRVQNEIYLFNNIESFLDVLSKESPSIVIIDALIYDDFDVLKQKLEEKINFNQIKVIFMTNHLHDCLESDNNNCKFILKPINGNKLLDIITEYDNDY